jgi:hypothetical protein
MKLIGTILLVVAFLGCSGDSGTREPDQPSPPPPTAGDGGPAADEPAPDDAVACVKSGCSGTLCVEEGNEMVTTCEWKPEYDCYRSATCERQADGRCGFSDRDALDQCIASKRSD